jgi:hypothetical protein
VEEVMVEAIVWLVVILYLGWRLRQLLRQASR